MSLRCGCPDEADEIVFGPSHRCSTNPSQPADLPRFIPSWAFVVPAYNRATEAVREVANLTQQDFTLCPSERPYETTLGPDELED